MKTLRLSKWIEPLAWIVVCISEASGQSLGDAARKEAERRKGLEQQGVSGKVIQDADPASAGAGGNLGVFSPALEQRRRPAIRVNGERGSPAFFRARIQKLDRDMRQTEDRLADLRERIAKERWSAPKVGGRNRSRRSGTSAERLQGQVRGLERKLNYLRQERSDAYSAGRRAGFLPGELDGKGIIP